jgi:hypothetical protein
MNEERNTRLGRGVMGEKEWRKRRREEEEEE